MAFSYDDVKDDALNELTDDQETTYADIIDKFVNDAIQICRKTIAKLNPEMIWTSKAINLVASNAGPYAIASDYETPVKLLDENSKEVGDSYRGEHNVSSRSGKPDGWWTEGYAPANLYVNSTPEKAYAWTLYYIATAARQAADEFDENVPLPDFCREPLVAWIVQMCGNSQEFDTTEEKGKILIMEELLSGILAKRRSKFKVKIRGVGF